MKATLITNNYNLSDKILLPDGKFHDFNFFKKYGTLSSLLQDLVTRKMTVLSKHCLNKRNKSFFLILKKKQK